MTPWQRAKQWQEDNDATATFEELLGAYLSAGYIWSTPKVFILANQARWNAEEKHFEDGPPNCWFVRLAGAAGHANAVGELLRAAPHAHDYVAWCRRGAFEPPVYSWDKLIKKVRI
jgi:hypothetical protein